MEEKRGKMGGGWKGEGEGSIAFVEVCWEMGI